ncbi:hypothetical protein BC939DRAFT_479432 [Gamsiella multidivaricata]|uniref:uncharacterized protein n=1 Tax=Gamsiella multidivaricata TaxID=101098 RepID=UPI0022206B03|nr:uncharacterized protein BC939DRAFT_479432 [Gamsiella multidivaricata]KAI7819570.1 hypothetical protein BC939DRAFT_479432 [Gamsiella multidivaricata]
MTSNNHRNYNNSSSSSSNGIRDTNSLSKKLVETELDMNQVDTNQEAAPPAQSPRLAMPQGHTKPETRTSGASISGVSTSSRQDRGVTANPAVMNLCLFRVKMTFLSVAGQNKGEEMQFGKQGQESVDILKLLDKE